jgi:hypothetical protein
MRQPNFSIIVSEKTTFDVQINHFVKLFFFCFVKLIFSADSIPFRASKLALPQNSECLGMSAFFRGIRQPFRVYSAKFFRNEILFPTLLLFKCPIIGTDPNFFQRSMYDYEYIVINYEKNRTSRKVDWKRFEKSFRTFAFFRENFLWKCTKIHENISGKVNFYYFSKFSFLRYFH